jgi:hypothetical protein
MRWLIFRALIGLLFYDLLLCLRGFAALYRWVERCPVAEPGTRQERLQHIVDAVHSACTWYPKHALCLQRSAVTTCLLRDSGIPAHMVIGAQRLPFKAHAWVEVDGRVVNDKPETCAMYGVLDRC